MKILIAGDYCPGNRVRKLIDDGNTSKILTDVVSIIQVVDYAIVNLECPVIGQGMPYKRIEKNGPHLCCRIEALKVIEEAGFKCVTLANNHIFDYGQRGIESTITALDNSSLDYVGAGVSMEDAQRTLFKDICGKRIAIISACENEFSIADDNHGGANELDSISLCYQIKDARDKADYVIVILHGGKEHYQLPIPGMKKTYRFLADCGADVIVNHHQHCFTGYEVYNGTPIFYGIGNFCFDSSNKEQPTWNYGYMVELNISESGIAFQLIPYEQCKAEPRVTLLTDTDRFFKDIKELNGIIADDIRLKGEYEKKIMGSYSDIMLSPFGNRYLRALAYRGLFPSLVSHRFRRTIAHNIRCAAHREGLLTWLKNITNK